MSEFAQDKLSRSHSRAAGAWRYVPGGFLVAFLALGLPLALWPAGSRASPQGKDMLTGEWAHSFEGALDQNLPVRDVGVRSWATFNYRLFHEGRPGVLVGTDGWLYTTEEFELHPNAAQARTDKVAYIRQVQRELRTHGAKLVIALVPEKARLYPEHLGRYALPSYNRTVYADFKSSLERAGVTTADVLSAMRRAKPQGAEFLRTDTHWTPFGAQVAAREIARTVKQAAPQLDLPPTSFKTTTDRPKPHGGDLLRYLPIPADLAPAPDTIRQASTEPTDPAGGGLLGGASIPIALIGTSYSANEKWNFDGALKEAFGADVLNVAKEGKGPIIPMREYLKGQDFQASPPQLVIWEIPERFLGVTY